jgi:hypothetical protein
MQAAVKDPLRRRAIALTVAAVLALAVAAAAIGWLIGSNEPAGTPTANSSSLTNSPTPSPSASSPSPTPSQTTASPTVSPSGDGLPDYAGRQFVEVFRELRQLKLGVRVVFEGSGDDQTVSRTDPGPGSVVTAGTTVTIYVKGGAALTTVPNLIGLSCDTGTGTAGNVLFEAGLSPNYGAGRDGVVIAQSPDPTSLTTRWNDTVEVTCGASPSATSSGPGG